MRGKRANKLITSPSSTKNNYTLSTEDKNHMSRALSRTMKLPNAEKPFQCNVCEKQVSEIMRNLEFLFFPVLFFVVKETSKTHIRTTSNVIIQSFVFTRISHVSFSSFLDRFASFFTRLQKQQKNETTNHQQTSSIIILSVSTVEHACKSHENTHGRETIQ